MSTDEQHVALPKLRGAPAYVRPAAPVAVAPRPFDPDDLPIQAQQTPDEREFAAELPARAWAPGGTVVRPREPGDRPDADAEPRLRPRPLSLRKIAGRLLGDD